MQGNSRIAFANTLRGLAALAVVISHYFGSFWSNRQAVETLINAPALPLAHATPGYIAWLHAIPIFNWGSYGVGLFFIISGFVIPFSLRRMSWAGFSINRIFRLIPTYVVGFTVTLLAVLVSSKYFAREWPYSVQEVLIHYVPGIRDLLWSRHIDGIVWTLEIEMKFYLLCAVLIVWFRRQSLTVFVAPVALFVLALCLNPLIPGWSNSNPMWRLAMTYMVVSQYIIFMFIGVAFHYLYCGRLDANKAYLGVGALFAAFCIHWWSGPYSEALSFAWSYAFAVLTFAFAYSFPRFFKGNSLFNFFADISYPLYVIHSVAGLVALRLMLEAGLTPWLSFLLVISGCFLLSWLLHLLVERPSQVLGRRLAARLTGASLNADTLARQSA